MRGKEPGRAGRKRAGWFEWAALGAATLLAALPFLVADLPGLIDLPNNVARLHIRAGLVPGSWYSTFYAQNALAIPNAAFDLFGATLVECFAPEALGRAFAVLAVVLTTTGVWALARAFGHRAALPAALAAALAHNYATTTGLLNFAAGLGLALWAAWLWLRVRQTPLLVRWLAGTAAALSLYVCHLFALSTYVLLVGGIEVRCARGPGLFGLSWRRLALYVATLVPVAGLLATSPASGEAQALTWEGPLEVLRNGAKALHGGLGAADYVHLSLLLGLSLLLWGTGRLRVTRLARLPLAALALTSLLCPDATLEASSLQQRLPVAVALVAAASLRWRRQRGPAWLVPVAVAVLLVGRTASLVPAFRERAAAVAHARTVLAHVPQGACLYTLHVDSDDPWRKYRRPIKHAACLVAIDKRVFLPQLLVADFHHTLRATPGFAQHLHQHYEINAGFESSADLRLRIVRLARLWRERGRDGVGAALPGGLYLFVVHGGDDLRLPLDLVKVVAGDGDARLLRLRE